MVGLIAGHAGGNVAYCIEQAAGETGCHTFEGGEGMWSFDAEGPYIQGSVGADSANLGRACFLSPAGSADCWSSIRQGDAWSPDMPDYPAPVHFEGPFVDMESWGYPARALDAEGNVFALGDDGSLTLELETDWVALEAAKEAMCGIRASGEIECVGCDAAYGICDEPASPVSPPSNGPPEGVFSSLSFDGGLACALTAEGEPVCWSTTYWPDYFDDRCNATPPSGGRFLSLTTSSSTYVCGIRTDGHAACWGSAVSPLAL